MPDDPKNHLPQENKVKDNVIASVNEKVNSVEKPLKTDSENNVQVEKLQPGEVKVVSNRPPIDQLLTPSFLCKNIVFKLLENAHLSVKFSNTAQKVEEITKAVDLSTCKDCDFNRKGRPVLSTFIEELKSCSDEDKKIIASLLGKKTKTSLDKKWIDVVSGEIIPFEFKTVSLSELHKQNARPLQQVKTVDENAVVDFKEKETKAKTDSKDFEIPAGAKLVNIKFEPEITTSKIKTVVPEKIRKIMFKNFQGPGDIVMLTAAIRDLHLCHKGKFITDVRTSSQHIWEGNPYVEWGKGTPLDENDPGVEKFDISYPLIHQSNQGPYHFSEAFTEEMEKLLGVRIDRRIGKGDIHIRPEEEMWGRGERKEWFKDYGLDENSDYWVIDAGHKLDFTAKFWGKGKFQAVVDHFAGKINFVQIGHAAHVHPLLNGVVNLVGKTDDRQLIRLIWASSGVLTPVSLPMVLAAAIPVKSGKCFKKLNRPCVVVAGGREPSRWQADTNHQFIHTCGCLPCCDNGGCWTSRTKPVGDKDEKDKRNLCHFVTFDDYGEEVPYCMHMISAEEVIRRIEMYYKFYVDDRKRYTYNS